MIDAPDAFARMGADVMRWQYCSQPPDRNLLFGFGPAQEIKRRLLTLWNSAKFLADYGSIEPFRPIYADLETAGPERGAAAARPLARRADGAARRRRPRRATSAGSRSTSRVPSTPSSTTSPTGTSGARGAASGTATRRPCARSGSALVQGLRVIAPVMPFLAEHLWQALVRDVADGAPESVFLAGWPEARTPDAASARRGRRAAERRRARAPGARGGGPEAAPAAAPHRRRGRSAGRDARRRDRRGAAREGGGVRPRRCRAAREAEPARARPEARQGARRGAGGAAGG